MEYRRKKDAPGLVRVQGAVVKDVSDFEIQGSHRPNLMRNQSFGDGISQEKGRPLVGPRGSCERRVRFLNPGFP